MFPFGRTGKSRTNTAWVDTTGSFGANGKGLLWSKEAFLSALFKHNGTLVGGWRILSPASLSRLGHVYQYERIK
jgi:hypothetical protein